MASRPERAPTRVRDSRAASAEGAEVAFPTNELRASLTRLTTAEALRFSRGKQAVTGPCREKKLGGQGRQAASPEVFP